MSRSSTVTKDQIIRSLAEDKQKARIVDMITDAIAYSFIVVPCRITRDEIRHRFQKAFRIWKELRAEMSYPLLRIEECLGQYLSLDIEGHQWNPLKRRTWLPGDPIARRYQQMPNAYAVRQAAGYRAVRHELNAAGFQATGRRTGQ